MKFNWILLLVRSICPVYIITKQFWSQRELQQQIKDHISILPGLPAMETMFTVYSLIQHKWHHLTWMMNTFRVSFNLYKIFWHKLKRLIGAFIISHQKVTFKGVVIWVLHAWYVSCIMLCALNGRSNTSKPFCKDTSKFDIQLFWGNRAQTLMS